MLHSFTDAITRFGGASIASDSFDHLCVTFDAVFGLLSR